MSNIDELLTTFTAQILSRAILFSKLDFSVKLIIDNRRTFIIECQEPVRVMESKQEADCTFDLSSETLSSWLQQRKNPHPAFLKGEIRVEGDHLKALQFSQVIALLPAA